MQSVDFDDSLWWEVAWIKLVQEEEAEEREYCDHELCRVPTWFPKLAYFQDGSPSLSGHVLHAAALQATLAELPRSGQTVEILTVLREEQPWIGVPPPSFGSVPNKPALAFAGQPMWVEFVLLRLLETDGWTGVWVKNWGGLAFWRNPMEPIELPPAARSLFSRIAGRTSGKGGCWDIFAWRNDDVLFLESKQRGRDRLRMTQRTWLESALAEGVSLSSFAIVEWTVLRDPEPTPDAGIKRQTLPTSAE